jgi:hypothetical protein
MNMSSTLRCLAALSASALLLSGCGGGGGDSPASPFGKSSQFSETEAGCSVDTQKNFVRAYLDETYLWYGQIPSVDPAPYTTTASIKDYFNALTNLPQDKYSEAIFSGKHAAVQQSMMPSSQLALDGLLASHAVPAAPTYATTSRGRVAYVQLRNHFQGAQDELITAFRQIQSQGPVQDLILDLRNNTGGFVYVALTAASMIAGPANNGQVFERLVFNDKRGESSFQFSGAVQFPDGSNAQYPAGTPLPQLALPRVIILTGGNTQTGEITCSASESIINSLRGLNVEVIRIGETTCGKPYGFSEKVNCGYSYFAIEFQGFNAQGFGDYPGGFEPTCRISQDVPLANRGGGSDPVYTAAVAFASNPLGNKTCPAGTTATGVQSAATPIVSPERKRTVGARRLLLPEQLPH